MQTLNVLAIDDNPNDLLLLRRKLERLGQWSVEFKGLNNIEDAQRALINGADADVVFLDYRLGATDGVEGIQRLRSAGVRLPLVLLTGQGDERLAARSRRSGADDYLCKDDLNENALVESLRYVLEQYRKEQKRSKALREALVDGLTGMAVKEYFHRRAEEEFVRGRRYGSPLSFLLLDLDHFKAVNDTWGHFAGDSVLRETAREIRMCLRATDIAGRFGGEEFGVILPECDLAGALLTAERIREQVRDREISHDGQVIRVTLSGGVSAVDDSIASATHALQLADEALYRAKREGRNRICAAANQPGELPCSGK
jgi:two-component system cell cycle response regulator